MIITFVVFAFFLVYTMENFHIKPKTFLQCLSLYFMRTTHSAFHFSNTQKKVYKVC